MKKTEIIDIWWEGPFSKEEVLENRIDSKYKSKATDVGLYQIYGSHPLYGSDVLVYIGRTKNQNGFQARLKNRWVIESGNDDENIKIYLGTIISYSENLNKKIEEEKIEKAEVLLISAMKPAFNSSNIQSVDSKLLEQDYIVKNHNNYRNIYPILSSEYFWSEGINAYIVKKLAKFKNEEIMDEDEFCGFNLKENDNIFVGIDYEYWNRNKVPLVIGIVKESLNKKQLNEIKKLDGNLEIDEKDEYYYISACDDLMDDKAIEIIEERIKIIDDLIKCKL